MSVKFRVEIPFPARILGNKSSKIVKYKKNKISFFLCVNGTYYQGFIMSSGRNYKCRVFNLNDRRLCIYHAWKSVSMLATGCRRYGAIT